MKEPLKPRDKFRQKMSRDGLVRENMTTGETENISSRVNENSVQDVPESLIQGKEISNKKSSRLTVDEHDAPIGIGGPALDEPVGLKLLEQLVEGLLTDVEQIGEFAGGDGAVHLEGGEHAAASPGGVRQRK